MLVTSAIRMDVFPKLEAPAEGSAPELSQIMNPAAAP